MWSATLLRDEGKVCLRLGPRDYGNQISVSTTIDPVARVVREATRDYERLLREQLYKIDGIRHSKSSFVLRQLKQSLLPLDR